MRRGATDQIRALRHGTAAAIVQVAVPGPVDVDQLLVAEGALVEGQRLGVGGAR